MSDMSQDFAEARARGEAALLREELAALRLMLREVGEMNANGIDYALRCQRERDEARDTAQREIATLRAERDAARELVDLHFQMRRRWEDGYWERTRERDAARAWSRLWHREARRLWREVQALSRDLSEEHREVMRLRSVIRRYLRTNPPQVEALRDLLFRSAAGEDIDADREVASARAAALREAADIARAHGGISAYYAIRQLAAEVEP